MNDADLIRDYLNKTLPPIIVNEDDMSREEYDKRMHEGRIVEIKCSQCGFPMGQSVEGHPDNKQIGFCSMKCSKTWRKRSR